MYYRFTGNVVFTFLDVIDYQSPQGFTTTAIKLREDRAKVETTRLVRSTHRTNLKAVLINKILEVHPSQAIANDSINDFKDLNNFTAVIDGKLSIDTMWHTLTHEWDDDEGQLSCMCCDTEVTKKGKVTFKKEHELNYFHQCQGCSAILNI